MSYITESRSNSEFSKLIVPQQLGQEISPSGIMGLGIVGMVLAVAVPVTTAYFIYKEVKKS